MSKVGVVGVGVPLEAEKVNDRGDELVISEWVWYSICLYVLVSSGCGGGQEEPLWMRNSARVM